MADGKKPENNVLQIYLWRRKAFTRYLGAVFSSVPFSFSGRKAQGKTFFPKKTFLCIMSRRSAFWKELCGGKGIRDGSVCVWRSKRKAFADRFKKIQKNFSRPYWQNGKYAVWRPFAGRWLFQNIKYLFEERAERAAPGSFWLFYRCIVLQKIMQKHRNFGYFVRQKPWFRNLLWKDKKI